MSFEFTKLDGYVTEVKNKKGYVIGVIEYDTMKHQYYFMAKKKEKIWIGDLMEIWNKISEMEKS